MPDRTSSFFIDTSFFIALLLPRDRMHRRAQEYLKKQKISIRGVTSNLILNELLTLFSRAGDLKLAIQFQNKILKDTSFEMVWIDLELHQMASQLLKKYQEHSLSFADASSFAIMKKLKLKKALSFDKDFIRAGFECLP